MKNPTILEGGIARVFSGIRKLFTRQSGSDDMIAWVPESDWQLTTKHITQNGVYRASDDGYYAYSSVTVSVPTDTGVTGEGDDGEQHYVAPDPETGELVDEVIPSSIVVETPPTPPSQFFGGAYTDGDTIPKTGMVVKAYLESGEVWTNESYPDGIIPNDEITLVPDKAAYEAGSDRAQYTADIDTSPVAQPIIAGYQAKLTPLPPKSGKQTLPTRTITAWKPMAYCELTPRQDYSSTSRYSGVIATDQEGAQVGTVEKVYPNGDVEVDLIFATNSYTYDDKTVYYGTVGGNGYYAAGSGFMVVDVSSELFPPSRTAWALLYGTHTEFGYGQTITAEWPRYGNGEVLSDTFNIVVRNGGENVNPGSVEV